jgi:hypothetical protein
MVITPHLLIGAAIGFNLQSLWAIFIFSLISHFIADKLPHWEYDASSLENKKGILIFFIKVAADVALGFLLLFLLLQQQSAWPYAVFGAFISALPDFPLLLYYFFPDSKLLAHYKKFHCDNHLEQNRKKIFLPIISELVVVIIATLFIKL